MEIWKDIPGYEGLYQVSNLGKVKNAKGLIRKTNINPNGYEGIRLCKDGKHKNWNVHKLLAITFLNHTPCGHTEVVDHIDGDRTNNVLTNLRLTDNRQNTSYIRGTSKYVGVYWNKQRGKWKAQIMINKKHKFLGYFNDEKEAASAYQQALKTVILTSVEVSPN